MSSRPSGPGCPMASRSTRRGSGLTCRHAASTTGQKVSRCSAVGSPTPHNAQGVSCRSADCLAAAALIASATCAALPSSRRPSIPTSLRQATVAPRQSSLLVHGNKENRHDVLCPARGALMRPLTALLEGTPSGGRSEAVRQHPENVEHLCEACCLGEQPPLPPVQPQ
eukprot:15433757-Alexandrium_andersonii.AAC.1